MTTEFSETFSTLVAADIETDEEFIAFHATHLRNREMPQLVHKNYCT